jgi:hypothetical protein
MKRRRVVLTIEAETVLTVRELRALAEMRFASAQHGPATLDRDPEAEKVPGACRGTIVQLSVNVVQAAKARRS